MNQRDEGHRLIRGRMAALGSAKTGAHFSDSHLFVTWSPKSAYCSARKKPHIMKLPPEESGGRE